MVTAQQTTKTARPRRRTVRAAYITEVDAGEEIQLRLVPDLPPRTRQASVALDELPPDHELLGPAPDRGMVESVRLYGVLTPILVEDLEADGHTGVCARSGWRYRVAAGTRRIKAARAAALAEINAVLVEAGGVRSELLSLVENAQRSSNPQADFAYLQRLYAAGAGDAEVCRATGLTVGEVRARLALGRLLPDLYSALAVGRLAPSVAQEAARLSPELQRRLLPVLASTGQVRAVDLAQVKRTARGEGTAALPAALFATPGPVDTTQAADGEQLASWRRQAADVLVQALTHVPPEEVAVRAALCDAERLVWGTQTG